MRAAAFEAVSQTHDSALKPLLNPAGRTQRLRSAASHQCKHSSGVNPTLFTVVASHVKEGLVYFASEQAGLEKVNSPVKVHSRGGKASSPWESKYPHYNKNLQFINCVPVSLEDLNTFVSSFCDHSLFYPSA